MILETIQAPIVGGLVTSGGACKKRPFMCSIVDTWAAKAQLYPDVWLKVWATMLLGDFGQEINLSCCRQA